MNTKNTSGLVAGLLAGAAVLGTLALGGCMGYSSWPPVEGNTATNDVNWPPTPEVMGVALRYVAGHYPPVPDPQPGVSYDAPLAINLPPGISVSHYREIAQMVGPTARPMIVGAPGPMHRPARRYRPSPHAFSRGRPSP